MKCMTPPVAHYMASFKMKIQCQRGKRAVTVKEVALLPTMTKLVASWLLDGMMWEVIDVDGMKAMILQGARTMEGIRHLTAPQHGMHAVTVKEAALGMETLVQQVPQKIRPHQIQLNHQQSHQPQTPQFLVKEIQVLGIVGWAESWPYPQ